MSTTAKPLTLTAVPAPTSPLDPALRAEHHYDLIIIGTGSGNMIPSEAYGSARIAIVEKGKFGGTCLNVGCIPTKMYVYAADIARAVKESQRYGVHAQLTSVDWPAIVDRIFTQRIDPIAAGGEAYRRGPECPTIDVYDQPAHFIAERTLATGQGSTSATISGDRIIIAAGARPHIPDVIADSGIRYYTNEDILRMPTLPGRMVILGGGVIAAEFAHVFSSLGVEVTVVNRSPRILKNLDESLSSAATSALAGVTTAHLGYTVTAAREDTDGIHLDLAATQGVTPYTPEGEPTSPAPDTLTVSTDVVLVAMGRTPQGDLLQVTNAGVQLDAAGRVVTDSTGRTAAEGVWALGDVTSRYQLKHVANHEAKVVSHNVLWDLWRGAGATGSVSMPEFNPATVFSPMGEINPETGEQSFNHRFVPAGIFAHPQIATVGLTEAEATAAVGTEVSALYGHRITVTTQRYGDVAYGWAMEDGEGFMKLVADATDGRLLGAHVFGAQATTLIQQLVTAMVWDIDVRDLAGRQYWIHPALPELTENALLGLRF